MCHIFENWKSTYKKKKVFWKTETSKKLLEITKISNRILENPLLETYYLSEKLWETLKRILKQSITNEGALTSGQKASGIGQNPTANPFWAERGT